MTASEQKQSPDFFEEHELDPLNTATGNRRQKPPVTKKKAGFYLTETLLDRFNHRFHQMKLDGMAVENKSALVEIALAYALDDLDKGESSVLKKALDKNTQPT